MFSTLNLYLNRFTAPVIYTILCRDNPNYCFLRFTQALTHTHRQPQYNVWCTQELRAGSQQEDKNEKIKTQKDREADRERARSCPFELKWGQRSEYRGKLMMAPETWTQTQPLSCALPSLLLSPSFLFFLWVWKCVCVCQFIFPPPPLLQYDIMPCIQNILSFFHLSLGKYHL